MNARPRILTTFALVLFASAAAEAISLSGKATADREAAAPLRAVDLGAVLDGAPASTEAAGALAKLPSRCRERAEKLGDCDDDLRCAWLAARGTLLQAWPAASESDRELAVARLVRAADRLAAGGTCGLAAE